MKRWQGVLLGLAMAVPGSARAQDATDPVLDSPAYAEASLRQTLKSLAQEAEVRRVDEEALGHARRVASGEDAPSPGPGPNGSVQFAHGTGEQRVYCRYLQLCDVEMQQGEVVQRVLVSDPAQFAQDGAVANSTQHVVISPLVKHGTCSVAIYTDRRVYHLQVVATDDAQQHMPRVRFVYPEDARAEWQAKMVERGHLAVGVERSAREPVEVRPEFLNFAYSISKEGRFRVRRRIDWAPLRAFDDGEKTYIEMPRSMLTGEAPILLLRNAEGTAAIVNYRVKGRHFIVDRLFQNAILVKGNGRKQERVRVTREED